MWARVFEVALGCWLLMGPFVFRHPSSASYLWVHDLAAGSIIVLLALLSFWNRTRRAHLLLLAVAGWLIGQAFLLQSHPLAPAYENHIVTALLLSMFAIIPGEASLPPEKWREFEARAEREIAPAGSRTSHPEETGM